MDEERRKVLGAGAALGAAALSDIARAADDDELMPPLPTAPAPGKPGEFGFLDGSWRIRHRRRAGDAVAWDAFEGEATCWSILGGVGSVEELRIPARDFAGLGLRLLDVERGLWVDHWVNARSGVLAGLGQPGGFVDGVGVFRSEGADDRGAWMSVGVWDAIGSRSCRWRQAASRDGGRTWSFNWIMHWTRV